MRVPVTHRVAGAGGEAQLAAALWRQVLAALPSQPVFAEFGRRITTQTAGLDDAASVRLRLTEAELQTVKRILGDEGS